MISSVNDTLVTSQYFVSPNIFDKSTPVEISQYSCALLISDLSILICRWWGMTMTTMIVSYASSQSYRWSIE